MPWKENIEEASENGNLAVLARSAGSPPAAAPPPELRRPATTLRGGPPSAGPAPRSQGSLSSAATSGTRPPPGRYRGARWSPPPPPCGGLVRRGVRESVAGLLRGSLGGRLPSSSARGSRGSRAEMAAAAAAVSGADFRGCLPGPALPARPAPSAALGGSAECSSGVPREPAALPRRRARPRGGGLAPRHRDGVTSPPLSYGMPPGGWGGPFFRRDGGFRTWGPKNKWDTAICQNAK